MIMNFDVHTGLYIYHMHKYVHIYIAIYPCPTFLACPHIHIMCVHAL